MMIQWECYVLVEDSKDAISVRGYGSTPELAAADMAKRYEEIARNNDKRAAGIRAQARAAAVEAARLTS